MSKTFTAPFAQTPKVATATASTASASTSGNTPTNTALLLTVGTDGAILTRLTAIPRSTVTAACLYLWRSPDAGTTKHLIATALLSAQTVATTTAITKASFSDYTETTPLRLQAGDNLYVGTAVTPTDPIVFSAEYTEF